MAVPETTPAPGGGPEPETPFQHASASRSRRLLRKSLLILSGLAGTLVLLLVLLLLLLQTSWGSARVSAALIAWLSPFETSALAIDRVEGNWVSRLELYGLTLVRADGVPLARIDTLRARYSLPALLHGRVHVREAYAGGVALAVEQRADATWDLLADLRPSAPDTSEEASSLTIAIDRLALARGTASATFYAPGRDSVLVIDGIDVRARQLILGPSAAGTLDTLRLTSHLTGTPGPLRLQASGALAADRLQDAHLRLLSPRSYVHARGSLALPEAERSQVHDLDFTVEAAPLVLADLAPLLAVSNPQDSLFLNARVQGSTALVEARAEARLSSGGTLSLDAGVTPTLAGPLTYRLTGTVRDLNANTLFGRADRAAPLDADFTADLAGPTLDRLSGPLRFTATRLHLGAYHLDVLDADGTFADGRLDASLSARRGSGTATVDGWMRPFDDVPSYDLQGHLRGVDLSQLMDGGTLTSQLNGTARLQGEGIDPQKTSLTAQRRLTDSRINRHPLDRTTLDVRLADAALDFDAAVAFPEGRLTADGQVRFDDGLRYEVRDGRIENLDLAALLGDTTHSRVNGTFAVQGRETDVATLSLDALRLTLSDTYYGSYRLRTAEAAGALRTGQLRLTFDADLEGGGLRAQAVVRPFDDVPSYEITRGRFEHVDLGTLLQRDSLSSDLNGAFSAAGAGFEPARMRLTSDVTFAPSFLNGQPIQQASLSARIQQGTLLARFDLDEAAAGSATLAGTYTLTSDPPRFAVQEGTFRRLNLGALLGIASLQTSLSGTLDARGQGADAASLTLDAHLALQPSRINHEHVQEGRLSLTLIDGLARLDGMLNLEQGAARLQGQGRPFDERPTYTVEAHAEDLRLERLAGISDTTDTTGLRLDARLDGTGFALATMELSGYVEAKQVRYEQITVDTLVTAFSLAEGALQLDSLTLASSVADAQARGTLALQRTDTSVPAQFVLAADFKDISPVGRFLGTDELELGSGRLDARVSGTADRLRLEATTQLGGLHYGALRVATLGGEVSGLLNADRSLAGGRLDARAERLIYGETPVREVGLQLAYVDTAHVRFATSALVDDRRDAQLSGQLALGADARRVRLDTVRVRLDQEQWRLLQPAGFTLGDRYTFDEIALAAGNQTITLAGGLDPAGSQDLRFALEQFRVESVADLLGLRGLEGTLDGSFELTGPAAAARMDGTLQMAVRTGGQPRGELVLDAHYDALRLNLDGTLTQDQATLLSLRGYVPMDLRLNGQETGGQEQAAGTLAPESNVSLNLSGDQFDLGLLRPFLDPGVVSELGGTLAVDTEIGGTPGAPMLRGSAALTDGRLGLPQLGTVYRNIEARATLEGRQVRLDRVTMTSAATHSRRMTLAESIVNLEQTFFEPDKARAATGTLTVQGTITLSQLSLGEFDLTAVADDFLAIDNDQYLARVSGSLAVSGSTEAPEVTGNVEVERADFYYGTSGTSSDAAAIELTAEDLRMLEEKFGIFISEADTSGSSLVDAMAIDVDVSFDGDVWIHSTANPVMDVELAGALQMNQEHYGDLLFFGTVETASTAT